MMKCHLFQDGVQFQDELFEYLDGTLSASAKMEVEAHLEQCVACRQAVRGHKALADRFRQETEFLALRPGLLDRVLSAVEEPPVSRFADFSWNHLGWPTAIAATFLVAAGLSLHWPFRARVPSSEAAHTPAFASVFLRESYCNLTYTFRREKNLVIDALTCAPCVVEENLSLSMNQNPIPQPQERKTPL